jgi:muramidase (phage lysozyme)
MTRGEKAAPILALIRKHESDSAVKLQGVASAYDVVYSGIEPKDRPRKLSDLTVTRVLWWQDVIDPLYRSEAAGAYQIMEDTLRTLKVDQKRVFDAACQDDLALQLLDRRGWAKCEAGEMTPEAFGNALAREWASLPVITGPQRGKSYYDGDGLNSAHATPEEVMAAIAASLAHQPPQPDIIAALDELTARITALEQWAFSVNRSLDHLEKRHA